MNKRRDGPKMAGVLMIEIGCSKLGYGVECVYGALSNRVCPPYRAGLEVRYFVPPLIEKQLERAVGLTELRSHPNKQLFAVDVPRPRPHSRLGPEVVPFDRSRD